MKIVIVGGGIAGLSTYLHLRKNLSHLSPIPTIVIYESHRPRSTLPTPSPSGSSTTTTPSAPLTLEDLSASTHLVGGGLGISPNGMRVLRSLSPSLHSAVASQGFPAENFVFKGANGWKLGMQRTSDKSVRGADEEEEVCIASSRHGLWECLLKAVEEQGGEVRYRKVIGIERDEGSERVGVRYVNEEGVEEVDWTDLLIGADGVKSVVRKALFGNEKKHQPEYTGQSGVGGFITSDIPPSLSSPPSMHFTFGPNGFFGYSSGAPLSAKSLMWWSTYETSTLPQTGDIDKSAIKDELIKRHQHWRDPLIQSIVAHAEIQSIYPTWVLGELPHWGDQGIVLVGDAAHAMDPTTGQGASQALEDSKTLSLLLAECLKKSEHRGVEGREYREKDAIASALKMFYEIRNPRVQNIVERGKKLAEKKANVGIVGEYIMYCMLWLMMKLPSIGKLMIGDVNRELYTWSAEEEIRKAFAKMNDTS